MPKLRRSFRPRHGKRKRNTFSRDERWRRWAVGRLVDKYGGLCCYCGHAVVRVVGHPRQATVDHLVPKAFGGGDGLSNLRLACASCNAEKADGVGFDIVTESLT